ncbi:hypothetical protein BGZ52_006881, partial [Haplosporangium bisporale]
GLLCTAVAPVAAEDAESFLLEQPLLPSVVSPSAQIPNSRIPSRILHPIPTPMPMYPSPQASRAGSRTTMSSSSDMPGSSLYWSSSASALAPPWVTSSSAQGPFSMPSSSPPMAAHVSRVSYPLSERQPVLYTISGPTSAQHVHTRVAPISTPSPPSHLRSMDSLELPDYLPNDVMDELFPHHGDDLPGDQLDGNEAPGTPEAVVPAAAPVVQPCPCPVSGPATALLFTADQADGGLCQRGDPPLLPGNNVPSVSMRTASTRNISLNASLNTIRNDRSERMHKKARESHQKMHITQQHVAAIQEQNRLQAAANTRNDRILEMFLQQQQMVLQLIQAQNPSIAPQNNNNTTRTNDENNDEPKDREEEKSDEEWEDEL